MATKNVLAEFVSQSYDATQDLATLQFYDQHGTLAEVLVFGATISNFVLGLLQSSRDRVRSKPETTVEQPSQCAGANVMAFASGDYGIVLRLVQQGSQLHVPLLVDKEAATKLRAVLDERDQAENGIRH